MSLIDVVQTNDNGQAAEYEVGTLVQTVIFIHQCKSVIIQKTGL
jgi:hypothetical protein